MAQVWAGGREGGMVACRGPCVMMCSGNELLFLPGASRVPAQGAQQGAGQIFEAHSKNSGMWRYGSGMGI